MCSTSTNSSPFISLARMKTKWRHENYMVQNNERTTSSGNCSLPSHGAFHLLHLWGRQHMDLNDFGTFLTMTAWSKPIVRRKKINAFSCILRDGICQYGGQINSSHSCWSLNLFGKEIVTRGIIFLYYYFIAIVPYK